MRVRRRLQGRDILQPEGYLLVLREVQGLRQAVQPGAGARQLRQDVRRVRPVPPGVRGRGADGRPPGRGREGDMSAGDRAAACRRRRRCRGRGDRRERDLADRGRRHSRRRCRDRHRWPGNILHPKATILM